MLDDEPIHPLVGYEAHFWLTWNGARIGDAVETLRRRGGSLKYERRERLSLRRGDTLSHSETAIAIVTDAELVAREITIWQLSDDSVIRGRARWEVEDRIDAEDRGDENSEAESSALESNREPEVERGEWVVEYGDDPARRLPGSAVPAELVPLLIATRWQADGDAKAGDVLFNGPVILAGYGFATAQLTVTAAESSGEPQKAGGAIVVASLRTPHGELRGRYALGQNGTVARVFGHDGSGAVRVDPRDRVLPFQPPELVDSSSLPIIAAGDARASGSEVDALPPAALADDGLALFITPVTRDEPPVMPGQRVRLGKDSWFVQLHPGDVAPPGSRLAIPANASSADESDRRVKALADRIIARSNARDQRGEIIALTRATAELVEDDLGAPANGARATIALGRGDCTAHASLFVALARARGIAAHMVTGYRIDGDRMVRHRWAIAHIGQLGRMGQARGAWISVDPTYGEAPAAPRLVGLTIHEGTFADLAMADELAFSGFSRSRAFRVQ